MNNDSLSREPMPAWFTNGGYLPRSFMTDRGPAYAQRPKSKPVVVFCGDEGPPNEASRLEVIKAHKGILDPAIGGVAIFGQGAGMAHVIAATGLTVYGNEFGRQLDAMGGFFGLLAEMTTAVNARTRSWPLRLAYHSDVTKERQAGAKGDREVVTFHPHGHGPIGCAYCASVGGISALIIGNANVELTARHNIAAISGNGSITDDFLRGHKLLRDVLGEDQNIGRQQFAASNLPVMVLQRQGGEQDQHLPVDKTGVILNLNPQIISNPYTTRAYRMDAGAIALGIRQIMPQLPRIGRFDLPVSALIIAQILEAVAVRRVLALHNVTGHKPDAGRLAIGVRPGLTFANAVKLIEKLEK